MSKILKLLVSVTLLFACSQSLACTCHSLSKDVLDLDKEVRRSDVIINAIVISCDTVHYNDTLTRSSLYYDIYRSTRLQFKVQIIGCFKGEKKYRSGIIEIITGAGNGDCGYHFKIGGNYIIYAKAIEKLDIKEPLRPKFLYTSECMRTQLFSESEKQRLFLKRKLKKLYVESQRRK